MAALDQYLNLYHREREAIDSHAFPAANLMRGAAAEKLQLMGRLPVKSDDGYEKTSIEDMFAPDLGVNVNRVNIPVNVADSFRCDVPNITTLLAFVINDRFVPSATLIKNLPEGVTVCSLRDADPALLDRWLGKVVQPHGEPVVNLGENAGEGYSRVSLYDTCPAFNELLLQDGVLIHVRRNVHVDKPIQLVDIFSSPAPLFAARRVLVVAEEGSRVNILKCDHTQTPDVLFGSSEVVEIYAASNASVDWYDIEESTPSTARYCQFRCRQEESSKLNVCLSTLTNGSTRNEFVIDITGDHCETRVSGMTIGSGHQHVDNNSYLLHRSAHCHSNQLFKYVLDEEATGAFEGCIQVAHNARFNEAYQSNRNLLASGKARMHTKPQLLIYNDDVKCSHGASTGQLDEAALFYMQTRGIPRDEARKMLMQAFMMDVVETVRMENLRDRLRHLLEQRFAGDCNHTSCAACSSRRAH